MHCVYDNESNILANIARAYHSQGRFEMALTYTELALTIAQELGDPVLIGTLEEYLKLVTESRRASDKATLLQFQATVLERLLGPNIVSKTALENAVTILDEAELPHEDIDATLENLRLATP